MNAKSAYLNAPLDYEIYFMKYMLSRWKALKVRMEIIFGNLKNPYMG